MDDLPEFFYRIDPDLRKFAPIAVEHGSAFTNAARAATDGTSVVPVAPQRMGFGLEAERRERKN